MDKKKRDNGRTIPKQASLIIMPGDGQDDPPKVGRDTLLNDKLIKAMAADLRLGFTDDAVCHTHSVSVDSFYRWIRVGKAIAEDKPAREMPRRNETKELIYRFYQAVTRARAEAINGAVAVFRAGFYPRQEVETTTETFSETRINPKTGEPYQYTQTTTRIKHKEIPGDWRAGMEWATRRDKEHWSNRQEIQVIDIENEAAKRVAAGELDYLSFMEMFSDSDMARRVWALAGVLLPDEANHD